MKTLLAALVLVLVPLTASAQVIINPTTIEFPASADHAATFGGVALVTKYELVVVRQSAPTVPVMPAVDLGKPTPVANLITVPVPNGLPNNTTLQVSVRTTGPGGVTPGTLSDPFGVVGPPAAAGKPIPKP